MVADNPDQKISLKMFHSAIQNNHEAIAKEEAAYKAIPIIDHVSEEMVMETYIQIKADIAELLRSQLEELKQQDEVPTLHTAIPVNGLDGRPLSRRQRKQIEKRQRRLERSALRKLKNEQTDEPTDERNGADHSPVKNDDTEQTLSM